MTNARVRMNWRATPNRRMSAELGGDKVSTSDVDVDAIHVVDIKVSTQYVHTECPRTSTSDAGEHASEDDNASSPRPWTSSIGSDASTLVAIPERRENSRPSSTRDVSRRRARDRLGVDLDGVARACPERSGFTYVVNTSSRSLRCTPYEVSENVLKVSSDDTLRVLCIERRPVRPRTSNRHSTSRDVARRRSRQPVARLRLRARRRDGDVFSEACRRAMARERWRR